MVSRQAILISHALRSRPLRLKCLGGGLACGRWPISLVYRATEWSCYRTGLSYYFRQHFPGSQTSTSSRRNCMKHSLRVTITIIFSSIHFNLNLNYDIFVNPASTYTYYRPFMLFHQSKVTETRVIFCDKQID